MCSTVTAVFSIMAALAGVYYAYVPFKPDFVSIVEQPVEQRVEWVNVPPPIIYQIYLRSYQDSDGDGIGDTKGLIQRLDYLSDLGIDTIGISSIEEGKKIEDFDVLKSACEEKGIQVMSDVTLNLDFFELPFKARAFSAAMKNAPEQPVYALNYQDGIRHMTRYGNSLEKARLLAMFLLTLRGTPVIYYGEEIGMKDASPPNFWALLTRTGENGSRAPMQWEPDDLTGFSTVAPWIPISSETCSVSEQENDYDSLLWLYKKLIHLRKKKDSLRMGSQLIHTHHHPDLLLYSRSFKRKTVWIALNFGNEKIRLEHKSEPQVLLSTDSEVSEGSELRPLEGIIWSYER